MNQETRTTRAAACAVEPRGTKRAQAVDPVARLALAIALLLAGSAPTAVRAQSTGEAGGPARSSADRSGRPADVPEPALPFKTSQSRIYGPGPTPDTDVPIRVAGIVAQAEVSQRFRNQTGSCVEGV